MIRKILAICIVYVFVLTGFSALSIARVDLNIQEDTVDNIPLG